MNTFKLLSNKIKTLKMAKNLLLLLPLLSGGLGAPHPEWMSQNKELGSIYQSPSEDFNNYNRDVAIFATSKSVFVAFFVCKSFNFDHYFSLFSIIYNV